LASLRPITTDELDQLQLDSSGQLYWCGQKVVLEETSSPAPSDDFVQQLIAGLIHAHRLTIEMLDRADILDRASAASWLKSYLGALDEQNAAGPFSEPLKQLIAALSQPRSPEGPTR
jgi:hypothetical protein